MMRNLLNLNSKTKMKINIGLLNLALTALLPTGFVQAQSSPAAKASPAPSSPARTDVYHVYFGKAAPGKAVQLAELLKTPNPKDPMPGHFIVLRHQEGDAWDYCVITHLGRQGNRRRDAVSGPVLDAGCGRLA